MIVCSDDKLGEKVGEQPHRIIDETANPNDSQPVSSLTRRPADTCDEPSTPDRYDSLLV